MINIIMKMMDLIYGEEPADILVNFIKFACNELKITSLPKFKIVNTPISNNISNSFASYQPNSKIVSIYVKHRHILDILRSLCHELVHYKQELENRLNADSGKTGSKEEDEANSLAGKIMRIWCKMHPEMF